jgi:hypothetical protein
LLQIIDLLEERKSSGENQALTQDMPETEEEMLKFLDMASLENQPTEVLVKLAGLLKDRRNNLYPQEVIHTDNSYEQDLFAERRQAEYN